MYDKNFLSIDPTFRSFFREFKREAILYCRVVNKLYIANTLSKQFCEKCKCKLRNVGYNVIEKKSNPISLSSNRNSFGISLLLRYPSNTTERPLCRLD